MPEPIKKTMEEVRSMRCMSCQCTSGMEFVPQGHSALSREHSKSPVTVHNLECVECGMRYTLWDLEITDLDEHYDNLIRQRVEFHGKKD